ncbi:quinon protein alcohol dehydrogenase-like superfamily [Nemania sp. FL0031]|nr:quinon protein alcohol dehydrogenase-like superfamily [Nemania sp. FL0031]
MRAQNPPSSPPSLESDRSTAEEDVSLQPPAVGSTAYSSSYLISASINHEDLPSSELASLLHFPTHAQSHPHATAEGVDEAVATDEEGDNDHGMVDVEEGGAPLYDINMEEADDYPAVSPSQGSSPDPNTTDASMDNVLPSIFDPPADPVATNAAPPVQQDVQPDVEEQDAFGFGANEFEPHPLFLTNANPGILMPDNHNSFDFLRLWQYYKRQNLLRDIEGVPHNEISIAHLTRSRITYGNLRGDECDLQGINWEQLGVTRRAARKFRAKTFRNYTNRDNSDAWHPSIPDKLLTRHENYFRFRNMDLRTDVRLLHFQLRNIMGCASRTAVYYPSVNGTVRMLDPTSGVIKTAMRFKTAEDASVSTLAAEQGILATGGFYGTYRYRPIHTEDESRCYDGKLTDHISGITNHVQVNLSRRSSVPYATCASNDYGFRIIDLARNEIVLDKMYDWALNCTALSPDKRLRVMVGDLQDILIAEAETGEILQKLEGHRDYGFACDWAPDGWTVATGNQDKSIRIWDARKWKDSSGRATSIAVLRSEIAGVRSLRFSPLGSGKRLLLAAEEADFINIVDAQTFNSKQTIDVFGELAGVSFTSGGQEIVAMSSDPVRGGVLCLERCDHGAEDTFNYAPGRYSREWWHTPGYDWLPTPREVVDHPDSEISMTEKRRQAAMAEDFFF